MGTNEKCSHKKPDSPKLKVFGCKAHIPGISKITNCLRSLTSITLHNVHISQCIPYKNEDECGMCNVHTTSNPSNRRKIKSNYYNERLLTNRRIQVKENIRYSNLIYSNQIPNLQIEKRQSRHLICCTKTTIFPFMWAISRSSPTHCLKDESSRDSEVKILDKTRLALKYIW